MALQIWPVIGCAEISNMEGQRANSVSDENMSRIKNVNRILRILRIKIADDWKDRQ